MLAVGEAFVEHVTKECVRPLFCVVVLKLPPRIVLVSFCVGKEIMCSIKSSKFFQVRINADQTFEYAEANGIANYFSTDMKKAVLHWLDDLM